MWTSRFPLSTALSTTLSTSSVSTIKQNKYSVYQKHSGPLILCVLVGGGRLIFGLNSEFVGGPIFHHNSKFVGPSHVSSNLCVFRGGLIFLPSSALVGPLIFIPNSDLTEPLIFIPIL